MAEFTKERIIEELKASTQNASGMFEIGEDTICALMSMLTNAAPQLPQPAVVPTFDEWCDATDNKPLGWVKDTMREACYGCRAAMLQGAEPASQPYTLPDVTLYMGKAMKVLEALKGDLISEHVRNAELGAMGATNVQVWTSILGGTLQFEASNGGCSLIVKFAGSTLAVPQALPDGLVAVPVEFTPEQMRAVQMNSELGAYTAANLSGAYSLFCEFWDVAIAAIPHQERNL